MSSTSKQLIDAATALVYIDDILHLAKSKDPNFCLFSEMHELVGRKLKRCPYKSIYKPLKIKFLGHEISPEKTKPIHSNVAATQSLNSTEEKKRVEKIVGSMVLQ